LCALAGCGQPATHVVDSGVVELVPDFGTTGPPNPFRAPYLHAPAGNGLRQIVATDFNGDGNTDVAAVAWDDGAVDVLLGDPQVALKPFHAFPVGQHPGFLAAGLIDTNSMADIVTLDLGDHTLSTLLGNGDGTFATRLTSPTETNLSGLALADQDRDGKLDVAYGDNGDSALVVRSGTGDGHFGTPHATPIFLNGDLIDTVSTFDFDNDTILDLLVGFDGPDLRAASLYSGLGNGSFVYRNDIMSQAGRHRAFLGQLNKGLLSPLVADPDNNEVLFVRNDEIGQDYGFIYVTGPVSIAVADFNQDGEFDIATANAGDRSIALAIGDQMGNFFPPMFVSLGATPSDLVAADVDHDGKIDLVVALPSEIGILFNSR
jgi:hypothetical protein